jgi:hypothetical protein
MGRVINIELPNRAQISAENHDEPVLLRTIMDGLHRLLGRAAQLIDSSSKEGVSHCDVPFGRYF